MKIYITRHGETEWNQVKRMHGRKNANLTEKGIEDAKRLGNRLKDINFDIAYTSPAQRAVDTTKYILGDNNTPIIQDDGLKEINFGKWEGMFEKDVNNLYEEQFHNFMNKPELFVPSEGGESIQDVIDRLEVWFNNLVNTSKEENILIVTHGVVKRSIYSILQKRALESFWEDPYIANTSLTILDVKDGEVSIILEADIEHIK